MSIKVTNLNKAFNGQKVLNDLSFEINEGEFTCIMGKSGIGKTTFLNILMGLMEADSGEIEGLKGKKLSCVFQEDRLCENITAVFNIKMVTDIAKSYSYEDILNTLKKVDIDGLDKKPVSKYSGGMKRRVAIVRALMADFDLLILDEPFKGLDDNTKGKCVALIKEMTKGKSVICVTHSEEDVKLFDARLIRIEESK